MGLKPLGPIFLQCLPWHCWLGHLTRKNPSPIWPIKCLVGCKTLPVLYPSIYYEIKRSKSRSQWDQIWSKYTLWMYFLPCRKNAWIHKFKETYHSYLLPGPYDTDDILKSWVKVQDHRQLQRRHTDMSCLILYFNCSYASVVPYGVDCCLKRCFQTGW